MSEPARSSGLPAGVPDVVMVDDDAEMRALAASVLAGAGYQTVTFDRGDRALAYLTGISKSAPTAKLPVLVSDIRMNGLSGLRLLTELKKAGLHVVSILITAFGDETTHVVGRMLGARAVLDKPFPMPRLLEIVRRELAARDTGPMRPPPRTQ